MKFINIPEGYIYTSHKNNEYQKAGNDWINCKTGALVESKHNAKINLAASKQIKQFNKSNKQQIGESYSVNGTEYVCVGKERYTHKKRLLSESAGKNIQKYLFEDGDNSSKDPYEGIEKGTKITSDRGDVYTYGGDGKVFDPNGNKLPDDAAKILLKSYLVKQKSDNTTSESSVDVPNGYVHKTGMNKSYTKTPLGWVNNDTKKKLNASAAKGLEDAAARGIANSNKTASTPIGFKWKSKKGNEYTYVGGENFLDTKGTKLPAHIAKAILADNEKNKSKEQPDSTDEVQSSDKKTEVQPDVKPEEVIRTDNVDTSEKNGKVEPTIQDEPKADDSSDGVDGKIKSLAQTINNHPKKRKLTVLLTRGDELSLMAADIILSGKDGEAVEIINSLK